MDSDGAGPSGSMGGGGGNYEFGVDPSMDPELAMALRMSLEEEQARQRAAEGASASTATDLPTVVEGSEATAATTAPIPITTGSTGLPTTGSLVLPGAPSITGAGPAASDESEEALLQQAIALSKGNTDSSTSTNVPGAASIATTATTKDEDVEMGDDGEDEEMDEEEAIARAIEMSLKGEQPDQK